MKNRDIIAIMIVSLVVLLSLVALFTFFFYGNAENDINVKMINTANLNDVYNILLLGKDQAAGLCDVIILTSIDMQKGEVNVMQIPRDTYFNYGNGEHNKINGAPCVLGAEQFVKEISNALGVRIDYYLCLDLNTLEKMVDMISGIEIDIPVDMDYEDPAQGLSIHLKAGKNTLNGKQALGFLRYRAGYATGDIGRLDAQKLFLNAFSKKVSEQNNPRLCLELFKLIMKNSETNIKEKDILSLAMKMSGKKDMKAFYMTACGEAVRSEKSGAWYYILSSASMSELLSTRFCADAKKFDQDNKFVDKRIKSFYDIYKKHCEYKIYSAEEIDNNQITIN